MVVGAHPMDAEILGGVLALRAVRAGKRSVLVHLTDGVGNYPERGATLSARQAAREASLAARRIGAALEWMHWEAADLKRRDAVTAFLRRLRLWRPSVVVTHWRGSWHERHRDTHRLVVAAAGAAGLRSRLYFGENFEDLRGFAPTHYVDTAGECRRWWHALASYELFRRSEGDAAPRAAYPYAGYYRSIPAVRGLEAGTTLAHAFMRHGTRIHRPTLVTDPLGDER